jgi:transposase-like protein
MLKRGTSKLTPNIAERLVASLRSGQQRNAACGAAGIAKTTLRDWLRQAEAGNEMFIPLALEVAKAEAECEARAVASIQVQGREDWRALAWYLERRFPLQWGDVRGHAAKLDAEREAMMDAFIGACARRGLSDACEEVLGELANSGADEAGAARGATQSAH